MRTAARYTSIGNSCSKVAKKLRAMSERIPGSDSFRGVMGAPSVGIIKLSQETFKTSALRPCRVKSLGGLASNSR